MPREHCHKTDTFLPEPTAASHPCSAEKRKNKCPATSRRHDRRRTGRGPGDTPCMNEPPPFRRRRSTASRGRRTRRTDCGTCTGRHGLTAGVPRPLRPGTKAPFHPDTFLATAARQGRAGRRPAAGSGRTRPQAGGNGRPFPRENIGTSSTKERREPSTEKAPGGLRKKPRTIRAEAQPAALSRRRTCPATETEGCGGNDFPRCLS